MTALDSKLFWIKQCAELLVKDVGLAISSLEEERKHKAEQWKVWLVYTLDSSGFLDYGSICWFKERADAYGYYRMLALDTLKEYNKHNPILLADFNETTYYSNNDYPEFWIDNKRDTNCHIWYEYEEVYLRELLVN